MVINKFRHNEYSKTNATVIHRKLLDILRVIKEKYQET